MPATVVKDLAHLAGSGVDARANSVVNTAFSVVEFCLGIQIEEDDIMRPVLLTHLVALSTMSNPSLSLSFTFFVLSTFVLRSVHLLRSPPLSHPVRVSISSTSLFHVAE